MKKNREKNRWFRRVAALLIMALVFSMISGRTMPEVLAADYEVILAHGDMQARNPAINGDGYKLLGGQCARHPLKDNLLYTAKNEREGFQVFFDEQGTSREIMLKMTPMTNDQGETLSTEVFREAFFGVTNVSHKEFADALVPYQGETVKTVEGGYVAFYVELHAAYTQTPGMYTGNLQVLDKNGEVLREEIMSCKVWNFALPENRYTDVAMGLYNSASGYGSTQELLVQNGVDMTPDADGHIREEERKKAVKILEAYDEYLLSHGMSSYEIPRWLIEDDPKGAELALADTRRNSFMIPEVGWTNVSLYPAPGSNVLDQKTLDSITKYKTLINDNRFIKDKHYFYVIDEIPAESMRNDDEKAKKSRLLTRELEKVWGKDYHAMLTYYGGVDDSVRQFFRDNGFNYLCFNNQVFSDEEGKTVTEDHRSAMAEARGDYDKVWRYQGSHRLGGTTIYTHDIYGIGVMRRILFWQEYMLRPEKKGGWLIWQGANWSPGVDLWKTGALPQEGPNGARSNGDGILFYPAKSLDLAPETVIASLRIKQLSDGLDDYDYLKLCDEFLGKDFTKEAVAGVYHNIDPEKNPDDIFKIFSMFRNHYENKSYVPGHAGDMDAARIKIGEALDKKFTEGAEHHFGNWELAVAPDDDHQGLEIRQCPCGAKESRRVDKAQQVQYKARYTFTSGTQGKTLPDEVKALLPSEQTGLSEGETVTPVLPGKTEIKVQEGTWKFVGYTPKSGVVKGADLEFEGKWELIPFQKPQTEYLIKVTYGKASISQGEAIAKAREGTTITLTALKAKPGMIFEKWCLDEGSARVDFADATKEETTFVMPAGEVKVTACYKADPAAQKKDYQFISGDFQTWRKGDGTYAEFRTNGDNADLSGLMIDGKMLDRGQYEVGERGVIRLKESYLKTLKAGRYDLTAFFVDGSCKTGFTVSDAGGKAEQPENKPTGKQEDKSAGKQDNRSADTGDSSVPLMWMLLMLAAAAAGGVNRARGR